MTIKKGMLAATVAALVLVSAPVLALENGQGMSATRKAEAQERSADAKLRLCQARQKTVQNIMTRMANRGQKHIEVFSKISDRVQSFYTNKGLSLSNYDALVADVAAKKTAAQAAVDALSAAADDFECQGTPREVALAFKDKLKNEISALKAYRTAVKNLIVGVKSVASSQGDQ